MSAKAYDRTSFATHLRSKKRSLSIQTNQTSDSSRSSLCSVNSLIVFKDKFLVLCLEETLILFEEHFSDVNQINFNSSTFYLITFLLTTISYFYQSPQSGKGFTFSFILCRPTGKVLWSMLLCGQSSAKTTWPVLFILSQKLNFRPE